MKTRSEEDVSFGDLLKAFWTFLGEHKARYVTFSALNIVFALGLSIVPYWIVGQIGAELLSAKPDLNKIYMTILVLTVSSYVVILLSRVCSMHLEHISNRVQSSIRTSGYTELMSMPYAWHKDDSAGAKVQRLNQGVSDLAVVFRYFCGNFYTSLASIVGIVIIFAIVSPVFMASLFAILGLMYAGERIFYPRLRSAVRDRNRAREISSGTFNEAIHNVLTVKSLGAEKGLRDTIVQAEDGVIATSDDIIAIKRKKAYVFHTVKHLGLALMLFLIVREVQLGAIAPALTVTYIMYYIRLFRDADDFADIINDLISVRVGVTRMLDVFQAEKSKDGSEPFPANWQTLNLRDVQFRYPDEEDDKLALDGVNITIQKGQKVGIVGETGGGKSTLSKLILGLYDTTKGSITVDHTPIQNIRRYERMTMISTVPQESELFQGTVAQNITMFTEPDFERLMKCIEVAQLESVVARLPQGISTPIGEKGYKLSGGQRQRIGIARALYSSAEILILDEATSALDNKTEVLFQESLEETERVRTLILIAHRLSTLRNVDIIYVVDEGRIVEQGTFTELMEKKGIFQKTYDLQKLH